MAAGEIGLSFGLQRLMCRSASAAAATFNSDRRRLGWRAVASLRGAEAGDALENNKPLSAALDSAPSRGWCGAIAIACELAHGLVVR